MANLFLDRATATMTVDGVSQIIDVSDLSPDIVSIQYNTVSRIGNVVHVSGDRAIGGIQYTPYHKYYMRWNALQNPIVMTPEEIKQVAVSEINAVRENSLAAGFTWNSKLWHTDTIFQAQITAYVSAYLSGLLAPTDTVEIRSKDNFVNTLTQLELLQLAGALMLYVGAVYKASWEAKDAL